MPKAKFILEFARPEGEDDGKPVGPECVHIAIGYAWQEGPDDLHVQFDGPAEDNFYVPHSLKQDFYAVLYRGQILKYRHMAWRAKPEKKSVPLRQSELESFWFSPNRNYEKSFPYEAFYKNFK
jgi:hypothetical protein